LRAESAFVNYPIVVGQDRRNDLYRAALCDGFDIGLSLYPDVQEMQSFTSIPGRTTNVANLVRSIVSLPTHPRVTPEYADELSAYVSRYLQVR
jgi:dTDP-4-amino-4,6-dideoxygalactose transaminase